MRKIALFALFLALPIVAKGQAVMRGPNPTFGQPQAVIGPAKMKYVARSVTYTLDRHGDYWADPPAGGVHLVWNGTAMVDRMNSGAWIMVGKVPQDTSNGAFFWPQSIATGVSMAGAGPFSSSNYYRSMATGSAGPLAFTASRSWTLCIRVTFDRNGTSQRLVYGSNWMVSQQGIEYTQGGAKRMLNWSGVSANYFPGPHVFCNSFQDNGDGTGTMHGRSDLSAEVTSTNSGAWTPPTAGYSQIGLGLGDYPLTGILHEVWASPVYARDATLQRMVKQAFGMIVNGVEISANGAAGGTNGANTNQTPGPNGKIWYYSENVMRVGYESGAKYGLLTGGGRYHFEKDSVTYPKSAAVTNGIPLGKYLAWSQGSSGTFSLTVNTAASPDIAANCTDVVAGNSCQFTISRAGTINETTTSGLTYLDIEDWNRPSTYFQVWVAGAVVPQTADRVNMAAPPFVLANGRNGYTVQFTAAPRGTLPWSQDSAPTLFTLGGSGAQGLTRIFLPLGGQLVFDAYDGTNARKRVAAAHDFADGSAHTITAALSGARMSLAADGTQIGTMMGHGNPGLTAQTSMTIGADDVTSNLNYNQRDAAWDGFIRNLTISNASPTAGASPAVDDGIVRIGVISDTHFGPDVGYIRDARIQMDPWGPDVLLHLGDIDDNPGSGQGVESWAVREVSRMLGGAPHIFVMGNHDIGTLTKAQQNAALPLSEQAFLRPGKLYGSTDIRGIHFIVTDSEYADVKGTPNPHLAGPAYFPTGELKWLAADIDATSLPVVVMTHRTINPNATLAVNNASDVQAILNARASKIAVVLNGHYHCHDSYVAPSGVFYIGVGSTSPIQTCSVTVHSQGDHTQIEINPSTRTVRVGWWENDAINGYLETLVVTHPF